MTFFRMYRRFNDYLAALIYICASLIIFFIVIALFTGAVTRYLTGIGYDWLAELPPQLVPWIVFPLVGVVLRDGGHLSVDLAPHYTTGRASAMLRMGVALVCIVTFVAFLVAGIKAVAFFKMLNQMSTTELQFPLWWLYLAFPVGFLLATNFAVELFLVDLLGFAGRDVGRRDKADIVQ